MTNTFGSSTVYRRTGPSSWAISERRLEEPPKAQEGAAARACDRELWSWEQLDELVRRALVDPGSGAQGAEAVVASGSVLVESAEAEAFRGPES